MKVSKQNRFDERSNKHNNGVMVNPFICTFTNGAFRKQFRTCSVVAVKRQEIYEI